MLTHVVSLTVGQVGAITFAALMVGAVVGFFIAAVMAVAGSRGGGSWDE